MPVSSPRARAPRTARPARAPRPPSAKRVCDTAAALVLLALAAVPLLLAAAAVAATAPGGPLANPFVRTPAAGLGGRPYRRWLLRTDGAAGSWLREHRLQGVPQLLNVVRGQMSLVGPRPDARPEPRGRLLVRPGMTGLWQVSARSDLPWEEMALLDLHYVEHHWLGMDLAILAQTPRAALRTRARASAQATARPPLQAPAQASAQASAQVSAPASAQAATRQRVA
ncbi:sugar transferase [Streptomyces sp. NBC_00239]|uniref:sugar transferase n=1 Tax=Streptomyces sp. NBC_00239 TaxID=2903640 RepID=UPI002E298B38|nr:sugar transferase [Streptomyces sp. NBC_00239]